MARGHLTVRPDRTLAADEEAASALGLMTRDGFDVAFVAGRWVLLQVAGGDADLLNDPAVVFAGRLESISAPDVISLVHSMGRDGALTLVFDDQATKTLFFKKGDIVFGQSSMKDDRLGECLVRAGIISRDQLETASMLIGTSVKLGKALVDSQMLSPHELWEGLKYQVEEILLSVFQYSVGEFAFTDGELNLRTEVRLSYPTTHYILEGVSRFDELREFYGRVSQREMVFLPVEPGDRPKSPQAVTGLEEDVFRQVNGELTVDEVLGSSNWSPHYSLLALARLLRAGWIKEGTPRETDPAEVTPPDRSFDSALIRRRIAKANEVLTEIYNALKKHEAENAQNILNSFFDELKPGMRQLFKNLKIDNKGNLDAEAMAANLLASSANAPEKYLMRGLSDLVGFALFTAGDLLPVSETEHLVEVVAHWSD